LFQAKPAHADSELGKTLTRDKLAQIGGRLNAKQLQAVKVQDSLYRLAARVHSDTAAEVILR
jgi:hypothetical protein